MRDGVPDPVLRACLFCRAPFPANDTAEHVAVGRRVAFDAHRGRLWIVCVGCGRWNLVPLELRWEALEELERLTTTRARLLASTDNIALLEAGGVELVRVGPTTLREEAWWRYGAVLGGREERAARARKWGKSWDATVAAAVVGIPVWGWRSPEYHIERLRRRQFGGHAWPERLYCRQCGSAQRGIPFHETSNLRLTHDIGGDVRLWVCCDRCGRAADDAGYVLHGTVAEHRAALLEATSLEERWLEEERIAAIVDGELS